MSKRELHPAERNGRKLLVIGGVMGAIWLGGFALGARGGSLVWGTMAVMNLALGLGSIVTSRANTVLSRAQAAMARGDVAQAKALVEGLDQRWWASMFALQTATLRAELALLEGDAEAVKAHARAASAAWLGVLTRLDRRRVRASAVALGAVGKALLGETSAVDDAAAVERDEMATADALARAALARALLLDRGEEHESLAQLLTREAGVLLGAASPRERALVRALRRKLAASSTPGYRRAQPAAEERAGERAEVIGWLERVAPAAIEFAEPIEAPAGAAALSIEASGDAPALPLIPSGNWKTSSASGVGKRAVVLWVVLILAFVFVWQFVGPSPHPATPRPPSTARPESDVWGAAPWLLFIVVFVAAMAWSITVSAKASRQLLAAQRRLAAGQARGALAALAPLRESRLRLVAVAASLNAATALELLGQRADALACCDAGLARVTEQDRIAAQDVLLPEVLLERALLLSGVDREAEALAELSRLEREFPSYHAMPSAAFSVKLVVLARRGDLEGAARHAAARPTDAPLSLRHEMLARLCEGLSGGDRGAALLAEARAELQALPFLRPWLDAYAPAVVRALGKSA